MNLLNIAQKIALTGILAVYDMPEIYFEFTEQLRWSIFDIPSPFEKSQYSNNNESSNENDDILVSSDIQIELQTFLQTPDDIYRYFNRVIFWVPVFFFIILSLHFSVILIILILRRQIPFILTFPRLEIIFGFWSLPAIAVASAALMRCSKCP